MFLQLLRRLWDKTAKTGRDCDHVVCHLVVEWFRCGSKCTVRPPQDGLNSRRYSLKHGRGSTRTALLDCGSA